ncbi:hypothetical protein OKW21_005826 [Catalinimonas alkaloidigena]|uniref:hypothetical protein n=1 Tax=Catalinimonas alkaloidigena TaxID=1075417 RepID=UPI0024064C7E|nr:hypothetical protein [Catalinimonas alkaloidigena]MDF9800563.1 hypothetical protein [Catalinimonas alkaloidigena]
MIKDYVKKVFPVILDFSISLDKTSSILDKPWVSVGQVREKFIFKKNHELIISKEGKVEIGKWEFLEEAHSFLINRESGKFLYNKGFLDKAVLILKVDSKDNEYLTLANENVLPDLNVQGYLEKLRYRKHNILKLELADGTFLEAERDYDTSFPVVGNRVTISGGLPAPPGKYYLKNDNQILEVAKGKIQAILQMTQYNYGNRVIEIEQQDPEDISEGDSVIVNGMSSVEGIFLLSKRRYITVQNGKVASIGFRKHVRNWIIALALFSLILLLLLYWLLS